MDQDSVACTRCRQRDARFALAGRPLCLRCMLLQPLLLKRSILTALVVGTILTAINQGNVLLSSNVPGDLAWKVPLTYCVPFLVATFSALLNTRIHRPAATSTTKR